MALTVILALYTSIGILAAVGTISLSARYLSPRQEQAWLAALLVPVAAMYLAFRGYLSPAIPLGTELRPMLVFAVLGLGGVRFTPLLLLGYAGHGAWDLYHEVLQHQERLGNLTAIPLAYGAFCAAFDWWVTGYAWTRRSAWATDRRDAR